MEAYKKQMHYFIDIKVKGNHIIEKLYAKADAFALPFHCNQRLHQ